MRDTCKKDTKEAGYVATGNYRSIGIKGQPERKGQRGGTVQLYGLVFRKGLDRKSS